MDGKYSLATIKWMVFTMPSLVKAFRHCLLIGLLICSIAAQAYPYATKIRYAALIQTDSGLSIQAKIDYPLSPTAKEALHKGVPLFWTIKLELRQSGTLWDTTIYKQTLHYRLQFHALLNQYEVRSPTIPSEMFLTLNAALGFMSTLDDAIPISNDLLLPIHSYKAALKCQFERERLPVPLRPFSYLDSQWFLSSDWYIWPIQK
jgi:hypothetical protein